MIFKKYELIGECPSAGGTYIFFEAVQKGCTKKKVTFIQSYRTPIRSSFEREAISPAHIKD